MFFFEGWSEVLGARCQATSFSALYVSYPRAYAWGTPGSRTIGVPRG